MRIKYIRSTRILWGGVGVGESGNGRALNHTGPLPAVMMGDHGGLVDGVLELGIGDGDAGNIKAIHTVPSSGNPTNSTGISDHWPIELQECLMAHQNHTPGIHTYTGNNENTFSWIDAGDLVVMPGVIDAHVHVNEPGRESWEGFETATKAAAAGGTTCLMDMPLNSIPSTTNVHALEIKMTAARNKCWIDVGFYGGIVPGNYKEVDGMLERGIRGFKAFLINSGVDEFQAMDDPESHDPELLLVMDSIAGYRASHPTSRVFLMFHAESKECCGTPVFRPKETAMKATERTSDIPQHYDTFLRTRPSAMESKAIDRIISLQRNHRQQLTKRHSKLARSTCELALPPVFETPCHIVHLATAEVIETLKKVRFKETPPLPLTVETCAHYLYFASEQVPDGNTTYKCCPPIRSSQHRDGLWQGIEEGVIDDIVSDHSPSTPELKHLDVGNFLTAWGGINGVQYLFSAVWSAMQRRHANEDLETSLIKVASWLSSKPARRLGLYPEKGVLRSGSNADIMIFDPTAVYDTSDYPLYTKNKISPYLGHELTGIIHYTLVRGSLVYSLKKGHCEKPLGKFI